MRIMEQQISSGRKAPATKLLLAQAMDFLPDPTFAIDLLGTVILWNRAMEHMTGITPKNMVGKRDYEYAIPFYGHRRPILIDLVLNPDPGMDGTYTSIRRDGDTLYAEAVGLPSRRCLWGKASPIHDKTGRVIGAIESIRDITDMKTLEENLQKTMNTYQATFENTSSAMVILEVDGTISLMNSEFERLSGFSREEVQGVMRWHDFVAGEDLDRMKRFHEMRGADPSAVPRRYEFRFKDRSGAIRDILLTIDMIEGTQKRIASLLDVTEWKNAERALRSSEEKYRDIFEHVSDFLYIHDLEGNYIETNLASRKGTGFTNADIANMNLLDIVPDRYRDQVRKYINRVVTCGYDEGVMTIRVKSGEERVLEYRSSLICDHAGRASAVRGSARDITSRLSAQKELRKERDLITSIIQTSPAFYDAIDAQGRVLFMNQAMLNALGYTLQDVAGKDYMETCVPQDERSLLKDALESMISSREAVVHENRVLAKDGRSLLVQWQGKAVFRESGQLEFIFGIGIDISAHRHAQELVLSTEKKFETVFQSSPVPTAITEIESGRIIEVNTALEKLIGYSRDEAIGRTTTALDVWNDPSDRERIIDEIAAGRTVDNEEVAFQTRAGEIRSILYSGRLIDINGRPHILSHAQDITERKRMEQELRESEEKFRLLFEKSGDATLILDEGRYTDCNEAAILLAGAPDKNELLSRRPAEISPEMQPDGTPSAIKAEQMIKLAMEKGSHQFEWVRKRFDGTEMYLEVMLTAIPMKGRRILYTTWRDISERKRIEKALRESEEKYRAIFENANEGIYQTSPEGRLLSVNPALARMFGFASPSEMIEKVRDIGEELYVDRRDREDMLRLLREQGIVEGYEAQMRRLDGSTFWISIHLHGVRDADGNIAYLEGTNVDITNRRQAQEALRQSEERFRRMAEVSPEIFWMATPDWSRTIYVSPAFQRITGISLEEAYRDPRVWTGLVHEDDRNLVASMFESRHEQDREYEFRIIRDDGSLRWISIRSSVVKDEQGRTLYLTGIAEDITERKRSEEEVKTYEARLLRSQKLEAIGTLAGGIAHDFNNILSAIIGYSELALDDLPEGNPVQESIHEVIRAGDRARDLVKQILTFSRQVEAEHKPVKVQIIAKEALKLLRSSIPSTITITDRIEAEASPVLADATQIHQIIMNLCTNAYHAMLAQGGEMKISLEGVSLEKDFTVRHPGLHEGAYLRLVVEDNGCGMDAETLKRIFDPFFTTKEKGKGTGLGLSTVHGIVTALGGAVFASSVVAQGSIFEVYLPVFKGGSDDYDEVEEPPVKGRGEHILLVDDEEAILHFSTTMLEQLGYTVEASSSSVEALTVFRSRPDTFDLVITDQTMPSLSGTSLALEILKIRQVPIVLMTGFSETITPEEAIEQGIREYLDKPFTKGILARTVQRCLKK